MKILLFGAYGNGNLGDAIQAESLARSILALFPHAEIEATTNFHRDYPFTLGTKGAAGSINNPDYVNSFDHLIIGGGGLLAHPHDPLGEKEWAEAIGIPIILWGVGATNFFAPQAEALIRKAAFVSGRDMMSIECLAQFSNHVAFVCDPVLADDSIRCARPEPEHQAGTLFVVKAPLKGLHEGVRSRIGPDDIIVGLEEHIDKDAKTLFPEMIFPKSVDSFLKLAAKRERVISMRYHGIILGIRAGLPCAALDVRKGSDLLKSLGLTRHSEGWLRHLLKIDDSTTGRTAEIISFFRQLYMAKLQLALHSKHRES